MRASFLCCLFLALTSLATAQGEVEAQVAELLRYKDEADPALVDKIALSRDRRAAEGLVKAYDEMASLRMRRVVLDALARFVDAQDAEQPAMTKLATIGGDAANGELAQAAIVALGKSQRLGKHFLRQIVDSEGMDVVREPALREHLRLGGAEDAEFYRMLWNPKLEQRKGKDGKIAPLELHSIRLLAFTGLVAQLGDDELVDTLRREVEPRIRRKALDELQRRSSSKTEEMAEWVMSRVDFPGADRLAAARILADRQGPKAVNTFLDLAKKRDVTQDDLRQEMAKLIANMRDPATDKRVAKLVGKGKPHEKVFALLASIRIDDPKLVAAVRKSLADSELEVRRAAAIALAARRDRESLPVLRAMLESGKKPGDKRIAVETIALIEGPTAAWVKELGELASNADVDVRNAAIEQIGANRASEHLPKLFVALAHDDWSTRLAAIDAAAACRDATVVPKFIERLGVESDRLARRIADHLWTFTAQPYEVDAAKWQAWWQEAGAKFTIVTEKELDEANKRREQARLAQRTSTRKEAKFFGIKVASSRVIFVIDVSGSMLESMYGRYVGKRGAARIDVAKEELLAAIDGLDDGALFNVFAFSSGVARWQKEGIGDNSAPSRDAAKTWVERLGASGATNLYDTMQEVFTDTDADTVFVLSDGEPTNGAVIDPHRIRQDVAFWNAHRKVKIHTIAIGSSLEILEWLATDSGGTYLQMR